VDALAIALALVYAYLVGAVPTAYLVGRYVRGVDIRRYGSGNVGAANAGRHLGKGSFILVGAVDMVAKGSGSVLVARAFGLSLEAQAAAGLLAAIGHNWSPYIRFRGGRGLAVTLGVLLPLSWKLWAALLAVALIGGGAFRTMALGFALSLALLPLWAWLFGEPPAIFWYSLALVIVSALKRLLSNPGTSEGNRGWKEKLLPRLLFDRDFWKPGDWVGRTPQDPPPSSMGH
jgi:glycerol-3-phosphate acyltransferase PlsY